MTNVEKMREIMIKRIAFALEYGAEPECYTNVMAVATRDVDAFISALSAEGFAEGVEDTTSALALVEDAETFAKGKTEGAEQTLQRLRTYALEPSKHWAKDMGYQQGAVVIIAKADLGLNNDGTVTGDGCIMNEDGYAVLTPPCLAPTEEKL
jgi:hypothetical protein